MSWTSNAPQVTPAAKWLIVGRGPSLQYYDEVAHNYDYVIACNATPLPCRPHFIVSGEPVKAYQKSKQTKPLIETTATHLFGYDGNWKLFKRFFQFVPMVRTQHFISELGDFKIALPVCRNVSYLAACVAFALDAARVDLIGIDFSDHSYSGGLTDSLPRFKELVHLAKVEGKELYNLSPKSLLKTIPFFQW